MLTEQQLADRNKGIGGSDAAAVCGLSKYKTPYQLFLEKTGDNVNQINNDYVYWGNTLEDVVANEYEKRTGKKLTTTTQTIFSKEHPFMCANVDRLIVDDNAILECKTSSSYMRNQWGEPGTDQVPTHYLLQCAHYAIVLNAAYVDLAVLIDSHDYRIYRYERNQALEEKLIEHEKKFWFDHVLKNVPPLPINNQDAVKLWNSSVSGMVTANSIIQQKIAELKEVKDQTKQLEEKKSQIELLIKQYLRNDDTLVDSFGAKIATWKSYEMARLDAEALKKEAPDIYKKFVKKSLQRKFTINI